MPHWYLSCKRKEAEQVQILKFKFRQKIRKVAAKKEWFYSISEIFSILQIKYLKMINHVLCPECESSKLALTDVYEGGVFLLCIECCLTFEMKRGILKNQPEGNFKRLIRNLLMLDQKGDALYVLKRIAGMSKGDAKAYIRSITC